MKKKQQTLTLKKLKIATFPTTNALKGGRTSICIPSEACQTEIATNCDSIDYCDTWVCTIYSRPSKPSNHCQ